MYRPDDRDDLTHAQLLALSRNAQGIPSPFVCDGMLSNPLTLRFADGAVIPLQLAAAHCPEALIARCKPASFGDGIESRYDASARDALQCAAADGAFVVEGFDPEGSGVLEAVRLGLMPDDPDPPTAELYSVNVYREGGFFVPNNDAPRGDDMIGALVVCASRGFSGGALTLKHREKDVRFEWGDRGRYGWNALPWAAFYGDVDHAVSKVSGGDRVTLSYVLRRGAGAVRTPVSTGAQDALRRQLARAIAEARFAPEGATLGFACEHTYAATPAYQDSIPALDAHTVLQLKGRDQAIAAAALELGLIVRLAPYLIEDGCRLRWRLSRFLNPVETKVFRGIQLDLNWLNARLPITVGPDHDTVMWAIDPTPAPGRAAPSRERTLLGEIEFSETGYFENEGCDGAFYQDSTLLIELPPLSQRAKLTASAQRAAIKKPQGRRAQARPATSATPPEVPAATPPEKPAATPPEKPAATPPEKPAATPPEKPASAPTPPPPPTPPMPAQLTAGELRAMGHSAAKVKAMLADGTLERIGFGWYRFTAR